MKIAIFTDFFLPSIGGVQTSIINQKTALERSGNTVIVFAPCYDGQQPFQEEDGVIRLPSSRLFRFDQHRGFYKLYVSRKVEKLLREYSIEVIHVQSEFTVGHFGLKLAKTLGIPSFYTTHTLLWKQIYSLHSKPVFWTCVATLAYMVYWRRRLPETSRLRHERWAEYQWRRLMLFTAQQADTVISPSLHLKNKYRAWGYHGRIRVVPNFTAFLDRPVAKLPAVPVLLWVGRLSPEKRPLQFIEAVGIAQHDSPAKFKTVICGSGRLEPACKRAAARLRDITFTAVSDYRLMVELYDSASVLVTSSYHFENQPMVIAEALARRRGIIYCDNDLTADGLAEGAGLLTGPAPSDMADGLRSVIENPAKLAMMAKTSVSAAERFSEQRYTSAIVELYRLAPECDNAALSP